MSSVILKTGMDRRLLAGHPWVYGGEVGRIDGDVTDGDSVELLDFKNRYLGRGLINQQSRIVVRRFTTQKEELDAAFFRRRIEAALAHRKSVVPKATSYRIISSESDQLPGLIVDKFGEVLVVQALTLGIDQRKDIIIQILRELLSPVAIIERSDVPSRRLEGLPEFKGVIYGKSDGTTTITVGGVKFKVDLLGDQKTGFFLDQAENYAAVAGHCSGKKVLDCFSYHGGFGLFAAKAGATHVEMVEISEAAVARARQNAELNHLTGKLEFQCVNAFDALKKYDTEKRQYDVIILDPPSFTRTKQNVNDALRGYKEINLRALKMLSPGGLLATFSCSHHVGTELLKAVVVDAAADAKKTIRLISTFRQAPDHPILPAVPETEYLKGFLLQVM